MLFCPIDFLQFKSPGIYYTRLFYEYLFLMKDSILRQNRWFYEFTTKLLHFINHNICVENDKWQDNWLSCDLVNSHFIIWSHLIIIKELNLYVIDIVLHTICITTRLCSLLFDTKLHQYARFVDNVTFQSFSISYIAVVEQLS